MATKADDNFGCLASVLLAGLVSAILVVGEAIGWKVAGIVVAVIFILPPLISGGVRVWKFFARNGAAKDK